MWARCSLATWTGGGRLLRLLGSLLGVRLGWEELLGLEGRLGEQRLGVQQLGAQQLEAQQLVEQWLEEGPPEVQQLEEYPLEEIQPEGQWLEGHPLGLGNQLEHYQLGREQRLDYQNRLHQADLQRAGSGKEDLKLVRRGGGWQGFDL